MEILYSVSDVSLSAICGQKLWTPLEVFIYLSIIYLSQLLFILPDNKKYKDVLLFELRRTTKMSILSL